MIFFEARKKTKMRFLFFFAVAQKNEGHGQPSQRSCLRNTTAQQHNCSLCLESGALQYKTGLSSKTTGRTCFACADAGHVHLLLQLLRALCFRTAWPCQPTAPWESYLDRHLGQAPQHIAHVMHVMQDATTLLPA
jgi:hypothetical protein